jgi:uncharacterized protein YqgV (UPF0045/DUF77 family)
MKEKITIEKFVDEINPIIKKYKLEGIFFAVGIRNNELVDECVLIEGTDEYILSLLENIFTHHSQMQRIYMKIKMKEEKESKLKNKTGN